MRISVRCWTPLDDANGKAYTIDDGGKIIDMKKEN